MKEQIRISAKNLGAVALPDFCPRCFWIKLKLHNRLPFQIFPGIFSSIDSYNKRIVHSWFDKHNAPPAWMRALGAAARVTCSSMGAIKLGRPKVVSSLWREHGESPPNSGRTRRPRDFWVHGRG